MLENVLINTIDGVKQDLLQDGRRIARLKEQTTYCLIRSKNCGYVTTRPDIAELRIQQGCKLYAKFNKDGDLIV